MGIYINIKVPVVVSANTVSGWSIIQANGSSSLFNSAMGPLIYNLEELEEVTQDLRTMGEARERDDTQGREGYRTRRQSSSREEYEAREEAPAAKETRSREEHRARESEDQTEMPQHKRFGHKRREYNRREHNPSPDCCLFGYLSPEQSQGNRLAQRHNSSDAIGLGIGCGCQSSGCGLLAHLAKDPNRAGPPQMSKANSNAAKRPPVPAPTGRFDNRHENQIHRYCRCPFPAQGGALNQAHRMHQPPAGNAHAAAPPADASRNRPRKHVEIPPQAFFGLLKEHSLKRPGAAEACACGPARGDADESWSSEI